MSTKQRKIVAAGVLGAVTVMGLGVTFGVAPQLGEVSELRTETATVLTAVGELETKLATLETQRDQLPSAVDELSQLTDRFPTDFAQDRWTAMVSAAAVAHDVEVIGLNPASPVPVRDVAAAAATDKDELVIATPGAEAGSETGGSPALATPAAVSEVTLTVLGSHAAIRDFVAAVESMTRPIIVDTVTVTTDGKVSTATLTGRTYLLSPLSAPGTEAPGTDEAVDAAGDDAETFGDGLSISTTP